LTSAALRASSTTCFLFKQKTAYELETWLEFRRVLFRSIDFVLGVDDEEEVDVGVVVEPVRLHPRRAQAEDRAHVRVGGHLRGERSEERRVGKWCRARWPTGARRRRANWA